MVESFVKPGKKIKKIAIKQNTIFIPDECVAFNLKETILARLDRFNLGRNNHTEIAELNLEIARLKKISETGTPDHLARIAQLEKELSESQALNPELQKLSKAKNLRQVLTNVLTMCVSIL